MALTGDANRMAGFAVSRAVGGAVVRNRVKRRLRAIMADVVGTLPAGSRVVVRALPASATATYGELGTDVRGAVGQALAKVSA
jgi:ribonuclease P protein component